jgi:hypothetical protein
MSLIWTVFSGVHALRPGTVPVQHRCNHCNTPCPTGYRGTVLSTGNSASRGPSHARWRMCSSPCSVDSRRKEIGSFLLAKKRRAALKGGRGSVSKQVVALCCRSIVCHHHHHHVTQSSHSINAIDPAPLWSGRKREHCSIMFATITHIPSLHKLLSNTPRNHPA